MSDQDDYRRPLPASNVRHQHDHDQNPDGTSVAANIASVKMTQSINDLIHMASMVDSSDPFKRYIIEKGQHDFRFQRATFDNQVVMTKRLAKVTETTDDNNRRLDDIDRIKQEDATRAAQHKLEEAYAKGVSDHEKLSEKQRSEGREKRLSNIVKWASFGSPVICFAIWIVLSTSWNWIFPNHPIPTKLGP